MNVRVNGQDRLVREGTTVAELLEELGLAGKVVAVEVNRAVVPKAEHGRYRLADGDQLEIVTLVGGG